MRRFALVMLPVAVVPLVALAACGGHATEETTRTVTKNGVTTTTVTSREVGHGGSATAGGSGVSIDSDKFKANVDIPGLTFGGDTMDLDGMKLYPGSTVKGMHVHAVDRPGTDKGEVVIDFTSPAAPAVVARHMADEARRADFTLGANTTGAVSGTKSGNDGVNRFAVTLLPNGDGTAGQLTMTGTKTGAD